MPQVPRKRRRSGKKDSCSQCEALRRQLREVLEQRDAALLSVARERERANTVLTSQVSFNAQAAKPIRYWAIDWLNEGLKRSFPLPHAGMRAVVHVLRRIRKEEA